MRRLLFVTSLFLITMLEYTGVKLYKFWFAGIDVPVIIEALTVEQARATLDKIWRQLDERYQSSYVLGETHIVPLMGVTTKVEKGIEYTWVGYDKNNNGSGWQDTGSLVKEAYTFEAIEKIYKL